MGRISLIFLQLLFVTLFISFTVENHPHHHHHDGLVMKKFNHFAQAKEMNVAAVRSDVPVWPYPQSYKDSIADGTDPSKAHHLCIPNGIHSVDFVIQFPPESKNAENLALLRGAVDRYKKEIFVEQFRERDTYERIKDGRVDLWQTLDQQRNETRQAALHRRIYPLKNRVTITVNVKSVEEPLQLDGVDESYTIDIKSDTAPSSNAENKLRIEEYKIDIMANQLWGALRALETVAQLVQYNLDHRQDLALIESTRPSGNADIRCMYQIHNVPIRIEDRPRYPWRGLMIDSSRHFLPVSLIKRIMDGMVSSKLNVLHWHLTDAQSFPFFVSRFPLLSQKGSYADHLTYSTSDLRDIVKYATDRGIRVVPELDMPGHAYSWGFGYPELIVKCNSVNVNNFPLDPTSEFVYEVIDGIIEEFREVFPDAHIHFGADELAKFCWRDDPAIQEWMKKENMTTVDDLWGYFQDRLQKIYTAEKYSNTRKIIPVFWQEIVTSLKTDKFTLSKDSVVTAWNSDAASIKEITDKGYRALFNEAWYLDKQKPYSKAKNHWLFYDTWEDMYLAEPTEQVDPEKAHQILGGEACMWGEQIDIHSIESRIWPRTSAAAERLWSAKEVNDINPAMVRIIHHACYHLARKGVRSNTIRPDYCPHTYTTLEQPLMTTMELAAIATIATLAVSTTSLLCLCVVAISAALYFYFRTQQFTRDKYTPLNYSR